VAYITAFKISGLAGKNGEVSRKLDRHLNIFFGLNGSGKTSLLKILNAAMANSPSSLRNVAFDTASVTIYSVDLQNAFTYSITKAAVDGGRLPSTGMSKRKAAEMDLRFHRYINASGDIVIEERDEPGWTIVPVLPPEATKTWKHGYLPATRMFEVAGRAEDRARPGSYQDASLREEIINAGFSEMMLQLWRDYFASVVREVSSAQAEGLTNILKAVLATGDRKKTSDSKLDAHQAYERVATFLSRQGHPKLLGPQGQFEKRFAKDGRLRSVVRDIDEVEGKIGAALAPRSKLETLINSLFSGGKSIHFGDSGIQIESGIANIDIAHLSSGEKQLLRLLVELLRVGECTLLIDEPEMSMHIDWQQELVSAMRQLNPDAQLIMATHSPEIMADVSDDVIFRI